MIKILILSSLLNSEDIKPIVHSVDKSIEECDPEAGRRRGKHSRGKRKGGWGLR